MACVALFGGIGNANILAVADFVACISLSATHVSAVTTEFDWTTAIEF